LGGYPAALFVARLCYNTVVLRKGGEYRTVPVEQKALSMLSREEMHGWQRSIWTGVRGASTRDGHPAPYPVELAERLIRLFSFAGDTVLDPFCGTGSTTLASINAGRNSVGNEIEPAYLNIARRLASHAASQTRIIGPEAAEVIVDRRLPRLSPITGFSMLSTGCFAARSTGIAIRRRATGPLSTFLKIC
jgi:hypothetical protein